MAKPLAAGALVRVDPIRFIEGELRHTTDRWAGKPFRLRRFQREFVQELFREVNGRRLYTRALLGLPRKNGKSELWAALGCKLLVADGTYGGEVISVAGDRAQARIVFEAAKRMVEFSPLLSQMLKIWRDVIEDPNTDSVWRVVSSDAPLKHGLRPSAVLVDEVHVQPTRELWDTLETGLATRQEPLMLGITTAGWDKDSLLGDLCREGEAGKDPRFLYRWVGLPPDSKLDYRSPEAWRMANPALVCEDPFLLEERLVDMSQRLPENTFRRLHLNQWTSAEQAALPDGAWDALETEDDVPDGTAVVLALAGTAERDSTALVGCTIGEAPHLFVYDDWQAPEDDPHRRRDPEDLLAAVREAAQMFDVRELVANPTRWSQVMQTLEGEGFTVTAFPTQSPARMAPLWQRFIDAVLEKKLTHDGDATLAAAMSNLQVRSDRLGTRPIDERSSPRGFVDAAFAALLAFERASAVEEPAWPGIISIDLTEDD